MFKKPNRSYLFKQWKLKYVKKSIFFKYQKPFCSNFILENSTILYDKFMYIYNINNFFFQKININLNSTYYLNKTFIKKYFWLISCFKYFFLKLRFYGKTFKWIFSKKKIKFRVQKPHRSIILFKNLKFKKKKKLKFKLRIFNLRDKKAFINCIKQIKYINIFTKKGMRILKMPLNKKKGKVSGYM